MPAQLDQDTGTEMDNVLSYNDNALTNDECHDKQKAQSCHNQEEELYNALEETQSFAVADGSVTFCQHFKYLRSFVSFNLCDNYDIKKRVTAGTQSMGALKNVWNSPHLDTRLGIPIFGSNFWDPHRKRNFDPVYDSKDSGRNFFLKFQCLESQKIGIPIPKFGIPDLINNQILIPLLIQRFTEENHCHTRRQENYFPAKPTSTHT
jgi:hypothetical protein